MRMVRRLVHLLIMRIRLVFYLAFIVLISVFFYWFAGGFKDPQELNSAVNGDKPTPVNKLDTNFPQIVKRYCNYPISNSSRDALNNAGRTNLVLRGLMIITRHGDRAPLLPLPNHLNQPRCGLWNPDDIELFRKYRTDSANVAKTGLPIVDESAPSTFRTFLLSPPNDRCRPGYLTAVGAVQMIRLGRQLREHYQDSWEFPTKSTECNARSTIYQRTVQSAMAFLYGWNGGFVGDSTTSIGGQQCKLNWAETTYFCSDTWCRCPNRIDAYRRDHHQNAAIFTRTQTKDKEIKNIVRQIGAILETPNLEDPVSAFDTLMGYACHREALPCNRAQPPNPIVPENRGDRLSDKRTSCMAKDWLQRLYNEAKNAEKAAMKYDAGVNLAAVESAPIMVRLSVLSEELRSSKKSILEYYSGHDVSLRPLLSVFGVWDYSIPPYAGHLSLEFVEDPNHPDDVEKSALYFRVLYNGDDMTEKVSSTVCSDSIFTRFNEAVFKLCNVNGLVQYAKKYLITLPNGEKQNGDEWVKLCK